MFGSVTRQERLEAARAEHARRLLLFACPCASITGMISRATNGNETKTVASTMPGTANMILMSCSASHGPSNPAAEQQHETMPEMTGDTANGRSISVISRFLPRKSNFAIAHAAADAEDELAGTAIAAASSVRLERRQRVGSRIAAT